MLGWVQNCRRFIFTCYHNDTLWLRAEEPLRRRSHKQHCCFSFNELLISLFASLKPYFCLDRHRWNCFLNLAIQESKLRPPVRNSDAKTRRRTDWLTYRHAESLNPYRRAKWQVYRTVGSVALSFSMSSSKPTTRYRLNNSNKVKSQDNRNLGAASPSRNSVTVTSHD